MEAMKKIKIFLYLFALIPSYFACTEEPVGQQPIDRIAPDPISDVKVKNTPGGAILTYKLPQDEDLLYVKAVYSLKDDGVMNESRASLYTDTLKVEGFGDTKERQVKIIAVDRSKNESVGVDVSITPLEAPVTSIGETVDLVADFGGVHAYWENPSRAEISVVILKQDDNDEYVPIETFYSTVIQGDGACRGMDTIPSAFGIYIQDRWENRSETKYFTLTPIYETEFDRLKFKAILLPGDQPSTYGWIMEHMWDGIVGDQGFSSPGGTGIWPHSVTIDFGLTGQISRVRLFQRTGFIFAEGNPKKFEVYGCQTLDQTGDWNNWAKLMDCTSVKPSGLPFGQYNDEDRNVAINGEDFVCSPSNPKVRYIRIKVTQTWAGGDNFQISELKVYGDNR
ncbi:MAG TPA: hypothetical protein DDW85_10860 [Porphyromonadaceae bacterium]|nr:hypothetical protein [Porphyromonadaceae bacterium]